MWRLQGSERPQAKYQEIRLFSAISVRSTYLDRTHEVTGSTPPIGSSIGPCREPFGLVSRFKPREHRKVAHVRGEQVGLEQECGGGNQVIGVVYAAVGTTVALGERAGGT